MRAEGFAVDAATAAGLYEALLASSSDALLLLDETHRILDASLSAERDLLVRRAELVGKRLEDILTPGAELRIGERQELRARRADGRELPIELTINAAEVQGKRVFVASMRDLSERVVARSRLEGLAELSTALASARTRVEVAAIVVERGLRVAGADICTLHMLDESTRRLTLVDARGVAPGVRAKIATLADDGTLLALMHPLWVESRAAYDELLPSIASVPDDGPRASSFCSVPLVGEGRGLGVLGLGWFTRRTFPEDERSFVRTVTDHCAQALLRAERLEGEDDARRRLATTLRSIGAAIITTDDEQRVASMNPAAEELVGYREDEARRRPLAEIFQVRDDHSTPPAASATLPIARTKLRRRDGRELHILHTVAPLRDENDVSRGVVIAFRDASAETRLAVQREFLAKAAVVLATASLDYRATLAAVAQLAVPHLADWCAVQLVEGPSRFQQVAVAHVDPAKVDLAREVGRRYPMDPEATTGVPNVVRTGKSELYPFIPRELLHSAARDDEHRVLIDQLDLRSAIVVPLRGRLGVLGAVTFVYAESGRQYDEADLAFAEDFAQRAGFAIENARALAEAAAARESERELRETAEIANRAKDEFLATVSHELRTPLNAILGWTVMLRGRKPAPELERVLAIIERNARAQARLVDDVLDVSRIISGKLSLTLGMTNVAATVRAAVESVAPGAEAKEVTLDVDLAEEDLAILADADRVQQIVWNLLSNALKFTPKGGRVVAKVALEEEHVVIRVVDSGEGMAADALPFVFEPFRQADSSTTRRHGGLGLGLAIVKQLTLAHGGTVAATSDGVGKGSSFSVRLPARAAVRAVRDAQPSTRLGRFELDALPSGALPRLEGLRVLVVDDEPDARRLVAEVLGERGAVVEEADGAMTGLASFARSRPDVIVSDIGMPGADGYWFLGQIRAKEASDGGETPAVALTAFARAEDAEYALGAGYQSHVTKPVEAAELILVVARLGKRS